MAIIKSMLHFSPAFACVSEDSMQVLSHFDLSRLFDEKLTKVTPVLKRHSRHNASLKATRLVLFLPEKWLEKSGNQSYFPWTTSKLIL